MESIPLVWEFFAPGQGGFFKRGTMIMKKVLVYKLIT